MADPTRDILDFWFGPEGTPEDGELREIWFKSTPAFDAEIARRFGEALDAAAAGELDQMRESPAGALALVILMDQFPRNLFRGTPRAFATDEDALAVAKQAVDRKFDAGMADNRRIFMYLPFEHSEKLVDQDRAVELMGTMANERSIKAAADHREVVRRFGRFPHRNEILGRANTPEEAEYLKDPPLWGKSGAEQEAAAKTKESSDE